MFYCRYDPNLTHPNHVPRVIVLIIVSYFFFFFLLGQFCSSSRVRYGNKQRISKQDLYELTLFRKNTRYDLVTVSVPARWGKITSPYSVIPYECITMYNNACITYTNSVTIIVIMCDNGRSVFELLHGDVRAMRSFLTVHAFTIIDVVRW